MESPLRYSSKVNPIHVLPPTPSLPSPKHMASTVKMGVESDPAAGHVEDSAEDSVDRRAAIYISHVKERLRLQEMKARSFY